MKKKKRLILNEVLSKKEFTSFRKRFDVLMYVLGILVPLSVLPQLYNIWILQDASGVSIITWSLFLISAFIWLLYGYVHRYKPVIIANLMWIFSEVFIIVGVSIYG
ncbi:MAG: hypothetical protein KKF56_01040 [Nanoarchaeota archaeon]|nr:hypothetical protein [Nanoarchaeota archaeon]